MRAFLDSNPTIYSLMRNEMIHKPSTHNNLDKLRQLSGLLNMASKYSIRGDSNTIVSDGFNEWVFRVRDGYREGSGEGDNMLVCAMVEMCQELFEELPELYFDSSASYEFSFLLFFPFFCFFSFFLHPPPTTHHKDVRAERAIISSPKRTTTKQTRCISNKGYLLTIGARVSLRTSSDPPKNARNVPSDK